MARHKALIRRWTAALNAGNVACLRVLAAPDCMVHLSGKPPLDLAAAERLAVSFRAAFPDGPLSIDELLAEGDKVVHCWTVRGTHQRDFAGIAATGQRIAVTGIFIDRVAGGKVVEVWASADDLGLLQQLGAVPTPEQARPEHCHAAGILAGMHRVIDLDGSENKAERSTVMSIEENKALVRRSVDEGWNKPYFAGVDDCYAVDFVHHDPYHAELKGFPAYKTLYGEVVAGLPDAHLMIEDLIAEGDRVVKRYTIRGTHRGDLLGVPPTGRQVSLTAITVYRIANGKIAEGWAAYDLLGLLQQLGAIPALSQAGR